MSPFLGREEEEEVVVVFGGALLDADSVGCCDGCDSRGASSSSRSGWGGEEVGILYAAMDSAAVSGLEMMGEDDDGGGGGLESEVVIAGGSGMQSGKLGPGGGVWGG